MQATIVLAVLAAVIALLVSDRVRPDVVSVLAAAALALSRVLTPEQALDGLSNPATVTVACMFVLSAGLQSSGFVHYLGDRVLQHGPSGELGLLVLMALVIAPISAFINNTAAVAVFLPVVLHAAAGNGVSPSRLMMPLAFLAILGGTCTIIGTSTNILVSSLAVTYRLEPFRMFDISPLGLIFLGIGAVYLLFVGRALLPRRVPPAKLTESYHVNPYLSEIVVLPGSALIGQSLRDARLGERLDLDVLGIGHGGGEIAALPGLDRRLAEGDILLVRGPATRLMRIRESEGVAIRSSTHPDDAHLKQADTVLLEAVVQPNSPLEGRTLKGLNFRAAYGATVLAVRRHGAEILEKIGKVRMQMGDELLVLAPHPNLDRLRRQTDFVILQELQVPVLDVGKAVRALLIIAGVVTVAAAGWYPIVVAAVVGSALMVLLGVLPPRRLYESVNWQVVLLLAGIIPLGTALETSGAAQWLVGGLMHLLGGYGPRVVLTAFIGITYLLTGVMSNNATAAVMVPLAIGAAAGLGVDSRPFLVAIMFAASAAFWTPFGYQTNLLVYGPGGYRFSDYVRVGAPLNVAYIAVGSWAIPAFFPFGG